MQDLLNTLQQIKDQAHPTLTRLVYERHPYMVFVDAIVVLVLLNCRYLYARRCTTGGYSHSYRIGCDPSWAPQPVPVRDDPRIRTACKQCFGRNANR